jgi:hypothetical protein
MRLCTKVVTTTQRCPTTVWASTLAMGARPNAGLFKFTMNKDYQVVLRGCKGMVGTKLGLDEDFTPMQQARNSVLWPLFKEIKVASKCAF